MQIATQTPEQLAERLATSTSYNPITYIVDELTRDLVNLIDDYKHATKYRRHWKYDADTKSVSQLNNAVTEAADIVDNVHTEIACLAHTLLVASARMGEIIDAQRAPTVELPAIDPAAVESPVADCANVPDERPQPVPVREPSVDDVPDDEQGPSTEAYFGL